jgi:hypothetical protein
MKCANCHKELKLKKVRVNNVIQCPHCDSFFIIENTLLNPKKAKYWYILLALYVILHYLYTYYENYINPGFSSGIASIATAFFVFILGIKYLPKHSYVIRKEISSLEYTNYKYDLVFPFSVMLFFIVIMLFLYIYGM